jgi:hypothetical protein
MSGLVLPSDNAVIDYSIISQIIAAINTQQAAINNLLSSNAAPSTVTINPNGTTTVVPAPAGSLQKVYGSRVAVSNKVTTEVDVSGHMTTLQGVVGTLYVSNSTANSYCWLKAITGTKFSFGTNYAGSNGYVYYVAVGL